MPGAPQSTTKPAGAPSPKPLRWARYVGVYLLLFLIGTETFLISPLLPTIAGSVGVTEAAAASAVTSYTVVYALTAPFLGAVSDRFGRQPMIVAGTVLFLLGNVVAALAGNLTLLVAARVLGALGAGFAGPAVWAHLAETAPSALRGRAVGLGMALFSAGQVVGVPAGSFIAGWAGWRASFWVLAGVTLATLPLVHRQTRPAEPLPGAASSAERPALRLGAVFVVWRDRVLRRTLIVVVLLQAANLGAYTYLGAVLHDRFALSVKALGVLGVLVGAGSALGALAAGRIGDLARQRGTGDAVWIPVWAALLGGAAALATLGSPLALAAAAVLVWFLASGAFATTVQTLLLDARPDLGATASSWNSATLYAGAAAGVAAIGLFPHADTGSALIGAGLALLAALTALPLAARPRGARQVARPPQPAEQATPSAASPSGATAATPSAATPSAATPSESPSADPAPSTAAASTPSVSTPSVSTPSVSTPSVSTPSVSTPSAPTSPVSTQATPAPPPDTPAPSTASATTVHSPTGDRS